MLPPLIYKLSPEELQKRADARKLRGIFRVDNDDYHGGPGISSTGIKKLLVSPAHFKVSAPPSYAMAFGTAAHMALLEPELFAATYLTAPECDRRTKEGKAIWADFQDTIPSDGHYEVLTATEGEQITNIVRVLGKSQVFRGLIADSERELAAYAICPVTGVLRKAKSDIIGGGIISDVKTCQSAKGDDFWRTVLDYGYHTSAAWYLDVFSDALREKINTFIWIAVEKSPPYGVGYFVASEKMLEIGRNQGQKALEIYKQCMKSGEWPGYPDEVTTLEFPEYINRRFA